MTVLGVEGHWIARAILESDSFSGEIPWDVNSVSLTVEMEGFSLPALELIFGLYASDYQVIKGLNGRSNITLFLGKKDFDFFLTFRVAKKVVMPAEHSYTVKVLGIAYPELFSDSQVRAIEGTSVDVLKQVFSEYVGVETLSAQTQDTQTWIQVKGESNRSFINRVWQHSYCPGSLLLIGFSDKARICDFATQVSTQKWKLSNIPDNESLTILNNPMWTSSQVRSLNTKAVDSIKIEDMTLNQFRGELPGIISPDKEILFEKGKTIQSYHSDNVHSNYFLAEAINYNRIASLVSCEVEIKDDYYPFRPFDSVFLRYLNKTASLESDPVFSGVYLIDRVTIGITKNQFQSTLKLIREDL